MLTSMIQQDGDRLGYVLQERRERKPTSVADAVALFFRNDTVHTLVMARSVQPYSIIYISDLPSWS
jgi:hypothetical protein